MPKFENDEEVIAACQKLGSYALELGHELEGANPVKLMFIAAATILGTIEKERPGHLDAFLLEAFERTYVAAKAVASGQKLTFH